jgi:serpin B
MALIAALPTTPSTARAAQENGLAAGNTALAIDLYGQLRDQPGNLFFSPYSISSCLAMAYAGARGETASQMAKALHFATDRDRLNRDYGDLAKRLRDVGQQKGSELNVANAMWTQKGHPFAPAFLETATGLFQANLRQADFRTGAEAARNEINQWVAAQTREKIQNLLPSGSLDPLTRLVLANAVYFKGTWAKPFEASRTSNQPFFLSASQQAPVPLMHHFDDVQYFENSDFQAVELPYAGGDLTMVVLLPRAKDGSAALETKLNTELLKTTLQQMRRRKVEIYLPKFKLESTFELNAPLSKLGMPDAFSSKADFSGIDGTRLLYISGVFHKAWGEVNEEGTEAAAATGVVAATRAAITPPTPPPVFRADHPFVFLIRDTQSGTLLFLGRLANPAG